MKFTIIAMVFGIELPSTVTELPLVAGRVFKNPIILGENWSLAKGANLTLYKEQDGKRQIDRDIVKYLVDVEIDTPGGTLDTGAWKVSVSGSGAVEATGTIGLNVFQGQVRREIEIVLFPLRLGTKARVIAIPAKVQGGSRDTVSKGGLGQPMPEPFGESTLVELTAKDCDFITKLSEKISGVDLDPYQVPIEIFQDSFYNINVIERGLNLITALESLLSQGSDSISFKLAYRTSCILDFGGENLYQTYRFIKKAYNYRSELVHGQRKKRDEARNWFKSNIFELEDIVRRVLFMLVELTGMGKELIGEENIDEYLFGDVLTGKSTELRKKIQSVGKLLQFHRLI